MSNATPTLRSEPASSVASDSPPLPPPVSSLSPPQAAPTRAMTIRRASHLIRLVRKLIPPLPFLSPALVAGRTESGYPRAPPEGMGHLGFQWPGRKDLVLVCLSPMMAEAAEVTDHEDLHEEGRRRDDRPPLR